MEHNYIRYHRAIWAYPAGANGKGHNIQVNKNQKCEGEFGFKFLLGLLLVLCLFFFLFSNSVSKRGKATVLLSNHTLTSGFVLQGRPSRQVWGRGWRLPVVDNF